MAWWLARTSSPAKPVWAALVAMPLVLPPTVIGFYLLLLMGPQGPVGQLTQSLGLGRLPFTFAGLVVASVIYSLPFVVQPLQQAFEAVPERTMEAAATLRASHHAIGVPMRSSSTVVSPASSAVRRTALHSAGLSMRADSQSP